MSPPTVSRSLRATGARVVGDLGFLVSGLAVGVVALTVVVVGLSVGASLLAVGVGVPVVVATLGTSRWLADRERLAVARADGRPLPGHRYRTAPDGGPPRRRDVLADPQCWRDALHAVVAFPLGVLTSVLALTCTVGGVAGLLYGAWAWLLPDGGGLVELVTGVRSRAAEIVLLTVLGAALLLAAPRVLSALVALRAGVARVLLTARRRHDALAGLSPREREVLGLMAEGRTNGAIGRALVIGSGAVEKHVASIFTKLRLPPSADDHRRVLAVVTWLTGRAG